MKKYFIILSILILTITDVTAAKPIQLNAGENQIIQLGDFIVLRGIVKKNQQKRIEYYRWEKEGKVLINTLGDEILYNDDIDAENDFKPTKAGMYLLRFIVMDNNGKEHQDILRLIVKGKESPAIKLNAGSNRSIKLGETVVLKGIAIGDKSIIDHYRWEENGKVLRNALADEILYNDESDAENDYIPTSIGIHTLNFIVESHEGKIYTKSIKITVKKSEDNTQPITREKLIQMIKNGEDVTQVNTSKITNMSKLFYRNSTFNQDISRWDTSNVTNMNEMFAYAYAFNQPIGSWNVSKVRNMSQMFRGIYVTYVHELYSTHFNQDLSNWDVSNVQTMHKMFYGCDINQDLTKWNVKNVSSWKGIFQVINVRGKPWIKMEEKNKPTKFLDDVDSEVFGEKEKFYGNYSKPPVDLSKPITRERLLEMIANNQDVTQVNTSEITNMSALFRHNTNFNQDISNWDTSNVTDMSQMFYDANEFNQNIGKWDVSMVTNMERMFSGYYYRTRSTTRRKNKFNQDLSNWNVSNVSNMTKMFAISNFNQNISNWDVSNVISWRGIFTSRFQTAPNNGIMERKNSPAKLFDLQGGI